MKSINILTIIICLAILSPLAFSADQGTLADQLSAHEKSLWDAIKNKNMDAFSAAVAPEILDIAPSGDVLDKQQLIQSFAPLTMTDYTLSDFKVFMLNEDCAVLAYASAFSGTMNAQPVSMKVTQTTTYVHQGGKWMPKFHTETPVAEKPAAPKQ